MNPIGALISAPAMAVAPPQASLGQPAGLGAVRSVARLIRNRRGPSDSRPRRGLAHKTTIVYDLHRAGDLARRRRRSGQPTLVMAGWNLRTETDASAGKEAVA